MIREDVSPTLDGCFFPHALQITVDEFIDVLIGTRKYTPAISVYNKIDAISLEQLDKYARQDHTVVISCELGLKLVPTTLFYAQKSSMVLYSLDYLIEQIWEVRLKARFYGRRVTFWNIESRTGESIHQETGASS